MLTSCSKYTQGLLLCAGCCPVSGPAGGSVIGLVGGPVGGPACWTETETDPTSSGCSGSGADSVQRTADCSIC